jgi:hypothetical protein
MVGATILNETGIAYFSGQLEQLQLSPHLQVPEVAQEQAAVLVLQVQAMVVYV